MFFLVTRCSLFPTLQLPIRDVIIGPFSSNNHLASARVAL